MMLNGSLKSYIHRKRLKQLHGDGVGVVANLPYEKSSGGGGLSPLSAKNTNNSGGRRRRSMFSATSSNNTSLTSSSNSSLTSLTANIECPELPLRKTKKHYEILIVACGCFWNPQLRFKKMEGVKRVIAGYSGGLEPFPNYRNVQDHALSLFIEFNPHKVSLISILEMWNDNDDPWRKDDESLLLDGEDENGNIFNYERSAIYTTSPEQHKQVIEFLTHLAATRPHERLHVDIDRATNFYQAEETQQDYLSKQVRAAKAHVEAYRNGQIKSGLFTIYE